MATNRRIYSIWSNMKARCFNEDNPMYEYYGEKGITICDEWANSFESFQEWALANGYSSSLTIDRIDSEGNYDPSNCRWATMAEQSINKGMYKNNTTGVRGVYRHRSKYRAEIKVKGKTIVLGQSDDINVAADIRKKGELLYYGKVLDN